MCVCMCWCGCAGMGEDERGRKECVRGKETRGYLSVLSKLRATRHTLRFSAWGYRPQHPVIVFVDM